MDALDELIRFGTVSVGFCLAVQLGFIVFVAVGGLLLDAAEVYGLLANCGVSAYPCSLAIVVSIGTAFVCGVTTLASVFGGVLWFVK